MDLIRRWIFRPKRSDSSLLAQFFYADRDLNLITDQLEKFDGHKNVEQFSGLITELRKSQDSLLSVIEKIMDEIIPESRASRDFRVKFPDDILQESLAGRLWFGAECLAAGSSIINHEVESLSMQPLAKLVTKQLGRVRTLLREQSLRSTHEYTDEIRVALTEFDNSFAEFELCYVSAMVPVKTMKDYDLLQEVAVLFSETVQRSLRLGWLSQEQLDMYDPALMFTIPRLAVICGLLVYPEGPLNPDMDPNCMSEMFRPFQQLLHRIRDLLCTLHMKELWVLEMLLSKGKDPSELNAMTCYEDLDRLAFPWIDGAYDCGAAAERNRLGADQAAGNKYRSKVTSPTLVAGNSGQDGGGLTEIGEFFAEVVRSCIQDDRRELNMNFDISTADGSRHCEEQDATVIQKQMIFSGVLNSDNLDGAVKCDSSVSNITPYDTSHDCRSPRTDPNQLSSQVTGAICVSDCSTIQRICCGCPPEVTSRLDPSVGSENPGQFPAVPAQSGVGESGKRTAAERQSRSSEENALGDEETMEDDAGSVLLCDSLEVSQSSCHASPSSSGAGFGYDWDRESYKNLVSNSNSICCDENDEEAMMLAIEVAETAAREEMQSLFRDSMDLIHRLFVCISGIADQLQTNFACDLRHILKAVFDSNTSSCEASPKVTAKVVSGFSELDSLSPVVPHPSSVVTRAQGNEFTDRPRWIPDDESSRCMSCQSTFTFVRRRHHCRNCGKVFCGQCSPNTVPLPHYGHEKPVRVCNHCFLFCVTPFTISN